MGAVEGVRVEVEDGFSGRGCGGGDDGFRQAGADDYQVEVRRLHRRKLCRR